MWNYARSAQQIGRGRQLEIVSAPGLKGRWSFSESAGTAVADSSGNAVNGTIVGTNWTRVAGAPFTPPGNAAPIATGDATGTNINTAASIAVLANDTDADGDALSPLSLTAPAHGTAVANANGTVLYTPAVNYTGEDSFTYSISDNQGGSAIGTVAVTIAGTPNLAPVVNAGVDQSIALPTTVVQLIGTATDDGVTGPTTTWSKVSGPGTVTFGNASALSTSATFSEQGTYVLQLSASDGVLSASDTMSVTVAANPTNKGLDLGGTNAYVALGAAPGLRVSTMTIETWFRRDGTGIATNTGSGGVIAIPLVTKGMAETEGGSVDMNYFLGIRSSQRVIARLRRTLRPAANHLRGHDDSANGVWRYVAATYDGTTWRLDLGRASDAVRRRRVHAAVRQHPGSAWGMALSSTGGVTSGSTAGFFDGVMDEARIWNYARRVSNRPCGALSSRSPRTRICAAAGVQRRLRIRDRRQLEAEQDGSCSAER